MNDLLEGNKPYDESVKVYRDNLATEQWALEMGEKKGLEKGIQIGREEGMKDGFVQTARGMKAAGIAPELIAQITGLSMEEIQGL